MGTENIKRALIFFFECWGLLFLCVEGRPVFQERGRFWWPIGPPLLLFLFFRRHRVFTLEKREKAFIVFVPQKILSSLRNIEQSFRCLETIKNNRSLRAKLFWINTHVYSAVGGDWKLVPRNAASYPKRKMKSDCFRNWNRVRYKWRHSSINGKINL